MAYKLGTPQNIVPTPTLTTVVKWASSDTQQSINSTGLIYSAITGLFTNNTILPLPIAVKYTLNLDITAGGYTAVGLNGSTELFGGAYNDTNSFSNSCIILVPAGLSFGVYYMDNTTVNVQASSRISCTVLTAGGQGPTGTTGPTGPNAQSALASYTLSVVQNIPAQTAAMVKWNTTDSGQTINNIPITLTTTGGNTGLFTNGTLQTLPVLVEYNLQLDVSGGGSTYIQLGGTASGVFGSMLTTTNIIRNSFVVSLIPGATMAVYYYDNSVVNVQTTYSRITLTVLQVGPLGPSGVTGPLGPTAINFWGYTGGTGPYGGTGINTSINYSQGYVGIGQGPTGSNTYLDTTRGGATAGTGSYVPQYPLDVAGTVRSAVHAYMDNSSQITASPSLNYMTFGQNWAVVGGGLSSSASWQASAMSATGQYQTVATNGSGISYSSNYGQTWSASTGQNASANITSIAMSASGQYQVACTYGTYGIYYSSNYGATWTVSTASTAPQWFEVCMSASGQYASACNAATSTTTYYSSNYGQSWTASATIASGPYQGIACSASGQYQVCACVSGIIYYSTTYGQTWINSNISSAGGVQYAAMSATGQYATVVTNGTGGPVWYSSNYGQTFTATTSGVGTNNIRGCAMSSSGQYQLAAGYSGGLYYSTNYGQTWTVGSSTINWFTVSMSANGQYCLGGILSGAIYQSITNLGPIAVVTNGTNDVTIGTSASGWTTITSANLGGSTTYPSATYGSQSLSIGWNFVPSNGGEVTFLNNYGNGFTFEDRIAASNYRLLAYLNYRQFFLNLGQATNPTNNGGAGFPGWLTSGCLYITPSGVSNNSAGIGIGYNTTYGGQLLSVQPGTDYKDMSYYAKNHNFYVSDTNKIVTFSAGIISPSPDNVVSLGSGTNRFTAVYAVNGTIQTSDSNEKNLIMLPYGLNELLQMKTIMFKWKSQDSLPDSDPTKHFQYYGLCADQLAAILPELVYNEDPTAPIQMNYSEIIPIIVKAFQEQNTVIQQQSTQITAHQQEITALQATVAIQSTQLVTQQSQIDALVQRLAAAGIA
jgi:hypothetical protein